MILRARMLKQWVAAFFVALLIPSFVFAQETQQVDYDAWALVAQRAETAIEAQRASNAAFEDLRAQIVEWRQNFLDAQQVNSARVETLQSQLTALGPAPAEGTNEAEDIAQRRAELQDQLTRLTAPIVTAEEAFNRADGMIGEIDRLIRERQTTQLFELGPTPLNPASWGQAWDELRRSVIGLSSEIAGSWDNPTQQKTLTDRAPAILVLLIFAVAALGPIRPWVRRLRNWVRRGKSDHSFLWQFTFSLLHLALPLMGVFALAIAINYSNVGGSRTLVIANGLLEWFGLIIVGQWLAHLIFADDDADGIYHLGGDRNRQARALILTLTVLIALDGMISAIAALDFYPDAARAVISFPILGLASVSLFRLAQLLTTYWREGDDEGNHANRLLPFLGRAMSLAALVAPVLAAIGYLSAAEALVYPVIRSLGPIGLIIVFQTLVARVYVAVTRNPDGTDDLVPVLFGYLLILGVLPVLALIWGARAADLTEFWTTVQQGVQIGETQISPTDFMGFVLIFVIGFMLTRVLQGTLRTTVLPKTRIDAGGQNAIVSGVGYVGIFLAAVVAISAAGIDLSSIALVAGALSVGIGFGLQNIVSNFVSGIILLIERPISQGDWIEVGGKHGYVRDISVRSTRVETFDRTDLIIPNSDLVSGQVVNWTRGNVRGRVVVPVGVAYGTDTKRVAEILQEIAEAHPRTADNPKPAVYFQGFGASSLDFEIRAVLTDVNWILNIKSDINHEIARRFAEEGIEIPFNQSEITIKNLEDWLEKEKKS